MALWPSMVRLMRLACSTVSSGMPCCFSVAKMKPGRMMGAVAVNSRLVKPSWAVRRDLGCGHTAIQSWAHMLGLKQG